MKTIRRTLAATATAALLASAAVAGPDVAADADRPAFDAATLKALRQTMWQVEHMPESELIQNRAARYGLEVMNVLWEDTGRFEGSAVGPNISDVTLQVREPLDALGKRFRSRLLPVLRHPNFSDKTADVAADKLWVKVGNQSAGAQLVSVPLTEVLKNLREYVSNPESVLGSGDLSAPRDSHMLVSAQHVFVPIPQQGAIEFTPVIFNYQSSRRAPAVLTLLVTRQGTSVVAIENDGRDASSDGAGQQLFFNNKGQKTTLTAERKSTVAARIEAVGAHGQDVGALEEGADMMMIIQVPLKVRSAPWQSYGGGYGSVGSMPMPSTAPMGSMAESKKSMAFDDGDSGGGGVGRSSRRRSDVEQAVLGHGEDLGDVSEGRGLKLVRDPRFPVRVTVQFYKATSNGVVSSADFAAAKQQIDKVYAKGDFVGSLVVPEGQRHRPTDWHLGHTQPVPILSKTTTLPAPLHLDIDADSADADSADADSADADSTDADSTGDTTFVTSTTPSMVERLKRFLFG